MQEQPFRAWLTDVREQAEGSIATRVADCRLVERHEGDLDAHWDADGLRELLDRLTYSREDERNSRAPKHNVPTKGDLYDNSATFKAAVNLYRKFLDARDDRRAENSPADKAWATRRAKDPEAGTKAANKAWSTRRWNAYIKKVQPYVESGQLDGEEVKYKLRIGDALKQARRAALAIRNDWPDLVKAATQGKYHPMAWREAGKLRRWIDDEPDAALKALRSLWTEDDRSISERIRSFSALYPWESKGGEVPPEGVRHPAYGTNGRGTRLRTISVLLMALDPSTYPPFMRSVFDSAYRRLGVEVPSGETVEEAQYEHALGFLDELVRRTTEHGLERPTTRLEAQSVLWAVRDDDPTSDPPPVPDSGPCWFVGASWDAGDQTDRFVREGIWQNDYEDKYLDYVKSIEPCDRIAIKATFVKKHGLPFDNRSEDISTMAIKATGVVTENRGDGRNLRVDWTPAKPGREWYFYTYQATVWKVTRDSGTKPWAANALIDFTFNGADQDYDRFLQHCPTLAEADLSGLADALLYDEADLRTIARLLDDKRQVIFQGPPGTGKTYAARELARFLAESDERVTLVQFHPSYAYEDFVQGYRPTLFDGGQAGFALRPGPLLTAAGAARDEPDAPHFLIIDEINRGNLAKVFGELYFLLEYRDEDMRLQYASADDEPFSLPKNLYIIGTMNTADRSIALVDLALRRRFHFVEFHPEKTPVEGLLGRWLERNAPEMAWVADVMRRANSKLDDRHAAIGPSYFMKEDLDEEKVRLIWDHNVLPYVEEHLYGETDRLAEFDLDKLRREPEAADSATAPGNLEPPGESDSDGQELDEAEGNAES